MRANLGVFEASLTLIFFSLPFWKTARKTTKKARISSACRTPKTLGKEGKNAQNRKEFLEKEKSKENQKARKRRLGDIFEKTKEKKDRAWGTGKGKPAANLGSTVAAFSSSSDLLRPQYPSLDDIWGIAEQRQYGSLKI